MLRLYNTLLLPLRWSARLWAWRTGRIPGREREVGERLARELPPEKPGAIWIHGASVGESRIVDSLVRELRRRAIDRPLVVSAVTPTGRRQLPAPPDVDHAFHAPLDFAGLPSRVIRALRPSALAIVETELWPNLLHEAALSGLPVGVVNGRLSPSRMHRYRRFAGLYRPLLSRLTLVGAQSDEDGARFLELGVTSRSLRVTGNVKYDLEPPEVDVDALRERLGLPPNRPVFVAGSTHDGEEEPVLDAFLRARGPVPSLLLVLAPRHPERADDVEGRIRRRGLTVARLGGATGPRGDRDVLLVDTLGQLGRLYGLAATAFVGGSLVPTGGHNVLEPAALGVPVLFGPHTQDFAEPARALARAGGGFRVTNADALQRELVSLLTDLERRKKASERARGMVEANRGALGRSVDLLLSLLEPPLRGERRP